MGVTGEVAQTRKIEPGAGGHLQHAAPRLVTQHLHLGRIEEPSLSSLVLPRQVVVEARHLGVQRQNLGIHDGLGQLCAAALAQGSPLRGQLAGVRGRRAGGEAERGEQQREQHAGGYALAPVHGPPGCRGRRGTRDPAREPQPGRSAARAPGRWIARLALWPGSPWPGLRPSTLKKGREDATGRAGTGAWTAAGAGSPLGSPALQGSWRKGTGLGALGLPGELSLDSTT